MTASTSYLSVIKALIIVILALATVYAIWWPTLSDPFFRTDDFPAFFGDASLFWPKTLNEGRWVNYLWHLRGVVTPPWLNFAVYQLGWVIFATATAILVIRPDRTFFPTLLTCLVIVVSPAAMTLSQWPNASIPATLLVATYALAALCLPQRLLRGLLLLIVPLTFMANTNHPLILLIICALRTDRHSIKDLIGLLAWFTACYLLAVLLTYSLNWVVHGTFGIPTADWRESTPAHDLAGLITNVPKYIDTLRLALGNFSFRISPLANFQLGLLALAFAVMVVRSPWQALYVLGIAITGLTLLAAQSLKFGMIVPARALLFAWVLYGVVLGCTLQLIVQRSPKLGSFASLPLVLIPMTYLFLGQLQAGLFATWQTQTRDLAAALSEAPDPIYIKGNPIDSNIGRDIKMESSFGLVYRIRLITGRSALACMESQIDCPALTASSTTLQETPLWRVSTINSGKGTIVELLSTVQD